MFNIFFTYKLYLGCILSAYILVRFNTNIDSELKLVFCRDGHCPILQLIERKKFFQVLFIPVVSLYNNLGIDCQI